MSKLRALLLGAIFGIPTALLAQTIVLIDAIPIPSGVVTSKYRDGVDGTVGLSWAVIGPFTNKIDGAGTFCVDLRTYLTEPGGPDATLSLVGTVANWSLATDDLCYDGTGVSAGTLIARASRSGVISDSLSFAVSSIASSGTDATEPTTITGVSVALNATDDPVITFDAPADVRVPGENVSGLDQFTVRRGATPLTATAFSGVGLVGPTYTSVDVSDLVPDGIATQDDANWTHEAEGLTSDTADEFLMTTTPITGNFTCSVKVASVTNPVANSRVSLVAREQTGTLRRYVATRLLPTVFNVRGHYRTVAEGAGTSVGPTVYTALPIWLQLQRTGNDWDVRSSSDGNVWTTVAETNLGLNQTLDVGLLSFSGADGDPIIAQYENLACQTIGQQSFTDTGTTANTTVSYTVISDDVQGNISGASAAVSIDIPDVTPPPPAGGSDTPDYVDPIAGVTIGPQTPVIVPNNAALAGAIAGANCGDMLQLAAGDYGTAQTINENCPSNNPLTIRGAANFTSDFQATLTLSGNNIIVTGLDFDAAGSRVRIGGDQNHFIANRVCCWGNTATPVAIFLVLTQGTQAEVAYNEFFSPGPWDNNPPPIQQANQSRIVIRSGEGGTGTQMHFDAYIHHNWFHDLPEKPVPGNYGTGQSDAIELCQTGQAAYILNMDSGWYMEYNRIDRHLGRDAIVDFKCGGHVWRYNTVSASTGGRVDLRNGSNGIIESNYHETSGGSIVHGLNHKFFGNILPSITLNAGNVDCQGPHQTGGTFHRTACGTRLEGNNAQLTIGNQDDGTFEVRDTTVRQHTGGITCTGPPINTIGACGSAAIPVATYDFIPAVELDVADVGPDALVNASAAYKAARGL